MEQGCNLYLAEQVRVGEIKAADSSGIEMYELMERAGHSVFKVIGNYYPTCRHVLVICGGGNNGGDGYVVARLARELGYGVTLWQCGDSARLKGDAAKARDRWLSSGGQIETPTISVPDDVDLIIDALLGTGLSGGVKGDAAALIRIMNDSGCPIVSVDIPSGLHSDTGAVSDHAVNADKTVTFIGRKQGLYTGRARNYTGEILFHGLGVNAPFDNENIASARLIAQSDIEKWLSPRSPVSHKGDFGRVLCMGGDRGMFGAIRLASEACLRTGAGLTRVVTQLENVTPIVSACPELIVYDWRGNSNEINDHLHWADVIALGPGLGTSSWGRSLLGYSSSVDTPMVLDADGLNLLAKTPNFNSKRIITPHPGEAARLLNISIQEVEQDRFSAVMLLQRKYGGVAVLKGAGTLVYDGNTYWVCQAGNPGMSSGGMGDVLTGIIAGLLGQGLTLANAACAGVWLHSTAADLSAADNGQRGMLASDLFPYLKTLINPD